MAIKGLFISYAHEDRSFAEQIAYILRLFQVAVWIDSTEMQVGDSLISKIREGVDQMEFMMPIISTSSVSSRWCQHEIEIAMNQEIIDGRIKVLPALLYNVPLPGFLLGKVYLDFTSNENFETAIQGLLRRVKKLYDAEVLPEILERTLQIGWITPANPALRRAFDHHVMKKFGKRVSPTMLLALLTIYAKRFVSQAFLGNICGCSSAAIKGLLDRLSEVGLIETSNRIPRDRRVFVTISPEGREWIVDALYITHGLPKTPRDEQSVSGNGGGFVVGSDQM